MTRSRRVISKNAIACSLVGSLAMWVGLATAGSHVIISNDTALLHVQTVIDLPGAGTGVTWSEDGHTLATYSSYGQQIDIWRDDGAHLGDMNRSGFDIPYIENSLSFIDNDKHLLTPPKGRTAATEGFAASLWDVHKGQVIDNILGPAPGLGWRANWAKQFRVSADRTKFAILTGGLTPGVAVYSTLDWTALFRPSVTGLGQVTAIALAPDGKRLAVGSAGGRIAIFDVQSRVLRRIIVTDFAPSDIAVNVITFSPDGKQIAAGAGLPIADTAVTAPIRIWDVEGGTPVQTLTADNLSPIRDIAWSSSGGYIAIATSKGVRLWNVKQNSSVIVQSSASMTVSFSPDGRLLAVCHDKQVTIFEIKQCLSR